MTVSYKETGKKLEVTPTSTASFPNLGHIVSQLVRKYLWNNPNCHRLSAGHEFKTTIFCPHIYPCIFCLSVLLWKMGRSVFTWQVWVDWAISIPWIMIFISLIWGGAFLVQPSVCLNVWFTFLICKYQWISYLQLNFQGLYQNIAWTSLRIFFFLKFGSDDCYSSYLDLVLGKVEIYQLASDANILASFGINLYH